MKYKHVILLFTIALFPFTLLAKSDNVSLSFSLSNDSDVDELIIWVCNDDDDKMHGFSKLLTKKKPIKNQNLDCNGLGILPFHPKKTIIDPYVNPVIHGINVINFFPAKTCQVKFNTSDYSIKPQKSARIKTADVRSNNKVIVSCNTIRK